MKYCFYCSRPFQAASDKQRYCSDECRAAAAKDRVGKKVKARQKNRVCKNKDCNNVLSVYNDSNYCLACGLSERVVEAELRNVRRQGGCT